MEVSSSTSILPSNLQNQEIPVPWSRYILIGMGSFAIGGIGIYFIRKIFPKSRSEKRLKSHPSLSLIGRQPTPFVWAAEDEDESDDIETDSFAFLPDTKFGSISETKIIIAIDATPQKCAALLRFPRGKKIFYYSASWHLNHFDFQNLTTADACGYDLINALVALEKFQEIISALSLNLANGQVHVEVKTQSDSNILTSIKPGDQMIKRTLAKLNEKMTILHGIWKSGNATEDLDLKSVHTLARDALYADSIRENYPGHNLTELGDMSSTFATISNFVKEKIMM